MIWSPSSCVSIHLEHCPSAEEWKSPEVVNTLPVVHLAKCRIKKTRLWSTSKKGFALAESASVGPARCATCPEVSRWSTRGTGTLRPWMQWNWFRDGCLQNRSFYLVQSYILRNLRISKIFKLQLNVLLCICFFPPATFYCKLFWVTATQLVPRCRCKTIVWHSLSLAKLTLVEVSLDLESWCNPLTTLKHSETLVEWM